MAVVLLKDRPAIDIIQGSYNRPESPWDHLGDPEIRARLDAAIASVGRLDCIGHPSITFAGTAFIAAPDLLMTYSLDQITYQEGDTYKFNPGQFAMVDFKHEIIPTDSFYFEVEEIVHSSPDYHLQLLRAKLPDTHKPLNFKILKADEVTDREVTIIGYPSVDSRNDTTITAKIFRGTFDVKRLLPGKITGHDEQQGKPVLKHDCTTSGGCAGAPMIDLETGEVLGVHFAGRYKKANYAIPTRELARDPIILNAGVNFSGTMPSTRDATTLESIVADNLNDELETVTSDNKETLSILQNIIFASDKQRIPIPESRPAFLIDQGRFKADQGWRKALEQNQTQLNLAVRAVGKVCTEGGRSPWLGTAFMVGDKYAITASYIASEFSSGAGTQVKLKPEIKAYIDFSEALGVPSGQASSQIININFIHPFFSVALLELDQTPPGVTALDLTVDKPSKLASRELAILSFAANNSRQPPEFLQQTYAGQWERLFLQPGIAKQLRQLSGGVPTLLHDCTTTAGSGGAPVIDLTTGYVVGVHTGSQKDDTGRTAEGYAQPTWELARDPHVWPFDIRFRPNPQPVWLDKWNDPKTIPAETHPPDSKPTDKKWTVDDVPINWKLQSPRDMETLLVNNITQTSRIMYLVENAGLDTGSIYRNQAPKYLWRDILKMAGLAGDLRTLIEEITNQPNYAGLAVKLKQWL